MSKLRQIVILAAIFAASNFAWGQSVSTVNKYIPTIENNGAVKLPVQNPQFQPKYEPVYQTQTTAWKEFTEKYGEMDVLIDKSTGGIHRAFGKPIRIPGYPEITKDNVVDASLKFLKDNSSVLKINTENLKLQRADYVNNRWYVTFKQYYKGIEVLLSEIELRIFKNGNVMAFGADYYYDINIPIVPGITVSEAANKAGAGLQSNPKADMIQSDNKLYILPVKHEYGVDYRLAYLFNVNIDESSANYMTYVDANNGELLWRQNMVNDAVTQVNVQAPVKLINANDPAVTVPIADMYLTVGSTKYTSDTKGIIQPDINSNQSLTAKFEGPWARMVRQYSTSPVFSATLLQGVPMTIDWKTTNCYTYEPMIFAYANTVHDYTKNLDTSLTFMDFQIAITIYDTAKGSPNASSSVDGKKLSYLSTKNPILRLTESSSVLFHEYGHSLNTLFFKAHGVAAGMVNKACHEGTADLYSALINDEPRMGIGVYPSFPDSIFRNLNNDLVYPDDIIYGDVHFNGQILSGAYWDLRKMTNLDYARHIAHYAKYGLPDDPDDGAAFAEYFIETIVADDDDGDLSNGTPHLTEIITCFNRHQIGTLLLLKNSFTHNNYPDTKDTVNPYSIVFQMLPNPSKISKVDSTFVVYSTDNFKTSQKVSAQSIGQGQYQASILAQKKGTIVKYYFSLYDAISKQKMNISKSTKALQPYYFLVGYNSAFREDFTKTSWSVGSSSDMASRGKWEKAVPQQADLTAQGYGIMQPDGGKNGPGTVCYVTGARFNKDSAYVNMPNGRTTLISVSYDLSQYVMPVLRFYKWFSNPTGYSGNFLVLSLSTNNGTSWKPIDSTIKTTSGWEKCQYILSDFVSDKGTLTLRFMVPGASISKALVDQIEILTAVGGVESIESENDFKKQPVIAYPNPFSENVKISYSMDNSFFVNLRIFDVFGKEVYRKSEDAEITGINTIEWNGTDLSGNKLNPGVYIYQLQAGSNTNTGKIVLVR